MTEIALGVVIRDGRLLVQARGGDPPLGGSWELPGGKRRADESLAEAVVREVAEETGLAVETGDLLVALSHRYPDRTVSLYAYLCRPIGGVRVRPEIEWVAPDDLRRLRLPAANPPILEAFDWERRRHARRPGGPKVGGRYESEPSSLDNS